MKSVFSRNWEQGKRQAFVSVQKVYVTALAKKVMRMAWAIAQEAQEDFGGSVRQYLKEALKRAWALIKADRAELVTADICFHSLKRNNVRQMPVSMKSRSQCAAYYAACW
ncbi:hypothetical protein [Terasakiella sp. SH-1]|uniref:hypothetical protein n=1 Tax=Terasakiella sp. SH-1 TaxID=2560057 RepID=UPI001430A632|nr:hypothetical protein [Terasakiella sp. SH-1]